jgi:dihydrodipicolinate reductase
MVLRQHYEINEMIRLVVAGATGKMGGAIIRESLDATADIEIVGALASRGGSDQGKDAESSLWEFLFPAMYQVQSLM